MSYFKFSLSEELLQIAQTIHDAGGNALLVGGAVRDLLLGSSSKDMDLEIYGISPEKLSGILSSFGAVNAVGKSFGVLKLSTAEGEYDVSIPRRDNKTGKGHRGFLIEADPEMSQQEAFSRRDFTINAIGFDICRQQLIDPFHGIQDLEQRLIRHVGASFGEDPLRVVRAMQFAGRFEFEIAEPTVQLCQQMDLTELPRERLFGEFNKLFLRAEKPSLGLKAAEQLGILSIFPELDALRGVPQDPEWHPEGDVWVHTLMVMDEAAKLKNGNETEDLALMYGALCHDFGKPLTTVFQDDRWRSPAHESRGTEPTLSFMHRLTDHQVLIDKVVLYVQEHLKPAHFYKVREQIRDGAIRRLALKINIPDLLNVATADHFGRTTPDALAREFPAAEWLLSRAQSLEINASAPKPILMGRHLLELGMKPGPAMGNLLKEAFELQLDGELTTLESCLSWAKLQICNGLVE
ncbi:MAG: polynucleotide adenylyltransferase [SAR324 cluster bacterium]|nr:polynucleotide adenylyltransferase [SAR324 cluster bacterium]